jgi:hypothetical protein
MDSRTANIAGGGNLKLRRSTTSLKSVQNAIASHVSLKLRNRYRQIESGVVLAAIERGWFGFTPLEKHIVVCGFPRSGTTLLAAMIHSCIPSVRSFNDEFPAIDAARFAMRRKRCNICCQDL